MTVFLMLVEPKERESSQLQTFFIISLHLEVPPPSPRDFRSHFLFYLIFYVMYNKDPPAFSPV